MGAAPPQPVGTAVTAAIAPPVLCTIAPALLDELWAACDPAAYQLPRAQFEAILLRIGMAQNFGLAAGLAAEASESQQRTFFTGLRLSDLVLARACADGHERAWERFIAVHREPLVRAAIAITGSDTLGRELADGLYAELYGLTLREGERRCPLAAYSGRGSLMGWLRTTLAQRHVDHHRRTHREQSLDASGDHDPPAAAPPVESASPSLTLLAGAVKEALMLQEPEDRFLLASYYLDGRTLHQIAALFGVHEATVSRKLKRATGSVRKQIVRSLERQGLSRRAAEEALGADPRDLTAICDDGRIDRPHLRLKELLQTSQTETFKEQEDR